MKSLLLVMLWASVLVPVAAADGPYTYLPARAHHILPDTYNNGSGYFSLCVGLDGSLYIGTAKYGVNAYLVEFDPTTERQRIVIDTHKVCDIGADVTGFAAQAKIHTRNFVGDSGKIYVGSKEGYRTEQDKKDNVKYPGGYLMTYDPRTDTPTNLGMPLPGNGVGDVVADEKRGLIYVITCEDEHWVIYDEKTQSFRELGPLPTRYASTLVLSDGRANVITADFQLAQYHPGKDEITTRDIMIDGVKFAPAEHHALPYWTLAEDGKTAYLIQMKDPTIIRLDLAGRGDVFKGTKVATFIEGEQPDCRSGLVFGPDGWLYSIYAIKNAPNFGKAHKLLHLVRFNPKSQKVEDLGVISVSNADFFDFDAKGPDGKPQKWTHGFKRLPDDTLAPMHNQGLTITRDGTIYATVLSPYTLLEIEGVRAAPGDAAPAPVAAEAYLDFALAACDRVESNLDEIARIAQVVTQRHMAGGLIGGIYNGDRWPGQGGQYELTGRSGGIMHIGFERPWKPDRTDAERAMDVAFIGFQREPDPIDLELMHKARAGGAYLIGMGPRGLPSLAEHVALCDAWLDTGLGDDDRIVPLGSIKAGRGNNLMNLLNGWALMAEIVAACTREGHMPTMWKGYLWRDGREWEARYFRKKQFHDDLTVAPLAAGELARRFLDRMRYLTRRFANTQLESIAAAADLIATEHAQGRKTVVAYKGHTLYRTVGEYEDSAWASFTGLHSNNHGEVILYGKNVPADSLLLRIDYAGMDYIDWCIFTAKNQRIIHVSAENDRREQPGWEAPARGRLLELDMGYAFGDACVPLEGYPILLFPPSGVMQAIAYGSINVEVLSRLTSDEIFESPR